MTWLGIVLMLWSHNPWMDSGQPGTTLPWPFSLLPGIERPGAQRLTSWVPVTIVLPEPRDGSAREVLRLVPSGRSWPAWRLESRVSLTSGEGRTVIRGAPGEVVLLVVVYEGPLYRLDGPFSWPGHADVRMIASPRRRTVRGGFVGDAAPTEEPVWVSGARFAPTDGWPACGVTPGESWECVGLPHDEGGVLLVATGPPVRSLVVPAVTGLQAPQAATARQTGWCRMLHLISAISPSEAIGSLSVVPRRGTARSDRLRSVRDPRVTVDPVGPEAFWVCGTGSVDGSALRVTGGQIATADVALDGWQLGPPALPHQVMLDSAVRVQGRVLDAAGRPAADAIVLVSRLERPQASDRTATERLPEFLVEVTANDAGIFDVPGIQAGDYEFRALHATLGQAVKTLTFDGQSVTLVLERPKRVRGRVMRAGRVVSDVVVAIAPDLTAYAAGRDPMDLVALTGVTDGDGRFELVVPPAGGGELRVGVAETGILRVPLPPHGLQPEVLDVGDLELPQPVRMWVQVDGPLGCDVHAVGPLGTSAMVIVRGQHSAGDYLLEVPEAGLWVLSLTCRGREVPIVPPAVHVTPSDLEVHVRIAPRVGD